MPAALLRGHGFFPAGSLGIRQSGSTSATFSIAHAPAELCGEAASHNFNAIDSETASAAPLFLSSILGPLGGLPKGWNAASTLMFGSRRSWLVASNVRVVESRAAALFSEASALRFASLAALSAKSCCSSCTGSESLRASVCDCRASKRARWASYACQPLNTADKY